jgi:hypothetical protein
MWAPTTCSPGAAATSARGWRSDFGSSTASGSQTCCAGWTCRAGRSGGRSFNVGVEIGQLMVVASALTALRTRSELLGWRIAFAGSLVVIAAGAFWFIQRVFFPV